MFPIPALMLKGGKSVPLPPGVVKSVVSTWYVSNQFKRSVAVLLNNGDLYTQGDNVHGELGDGTVTANNNTWYKTATNIKRVFAASQCFVTEDNAGIWKFAGYQPGLVGIGDNVPTWTALPSTITSTLDMTTIKDVHGGPGATMWLLNDGRMFGSGINANGCMGKGSLTASYDTPVIVQNAVKRVMVGAARTVYVNSDTGLAYSAGTPGNILGNGSVDTTPNFRLINTPLNFFIEDMISFGTVTIFIGHMSSDPATKMIYSIGILSNDAYTKETTKFGAGFTDYMVPSGYFANFFGVAGKLYGYGTGPQGTPDGNTNTTPMEPTFMFLGEWDLSKINQITISPGINGDNTAPGGGHFLVYDHNLFFTGVSTINQGKYNSTKFKNISEFNT